MRQLQKSQTKIIYLYRAAYFDLYFLRLFSLQPTHLQKRRLTGIILSGIHSPKDNRPIQAESWRKNLSVPELP